MSPSSIVLVSVLSVACSLPSGLHSLGSLNHATGRASGNVARGISSAHQGSQISQVGATAGGSVAGRAVSQNRAAASNRSKNGYQGPQHTSNTNAISNQRTFDNQGPQGFNQGSHQGLRKFNQRFNQNQGFNQDFSQGNQGFNQVFNQGLTPNYNQGLNQGLISGFNPSIGIGFNSGFNQGFQAPGRGFNSFNRLPVRQHLGGTGFNRHQNGY